MTATHSRNLLIALLTAASAVAIGWGVFHKHATQAVLRVAPTAPATTTVAATAPASRPAAPTDFLGLIRNDDPDFPATEPLAIPAELHEGATLIVHEPLYLDSLGDLWITRTDAPADAKFLKTANDDQVHFVRERVLFVHHVLDDSQQWQPQFVCRDGQGNFILISAEGRLNLGKRYRYHWDHAFDWNSTTNEGFVVPTDTGVSIFRPRSLPVELHYDFAASTPSPATSPTGTPTTAAATAATAPATPMALPQMLLDSRGLLAWIPWEGDSPGSNGAARFVDEKWQPLGPDQGWPQKILHLIPLVGGGVLQLTPSEDGTVTESLGQLDAAPIDQNIVDPLIAKLSDPDPTVRDGAYDELTRYGPSLWPILEKEIDDQPPEGELRMKRLLAAKQSPTLGHMTLLPGKVRVVSHLEDGGVLLFAEGGIAVPNNDPAQPPLATVPAYINIRPSQPIALAPPALVADLPPDARFDIAPEEWVETDAAHGPRRLLGNHMEPLLRKSERAYSRFIGIDRRGRWLFRKPDSDTPTLILDPNLPDATPRLAAWNQPVECDVVGWDDAGWPVVMKGGNAWALHAEEWSPLPAPQKYYKSLDEMPRAPMTSKPPAPTTASRQPTLIFTDLDGTYFDGANALDIERLNGSSAHWPLPPAAVGNGEIHLLRAGDRLFLFNQPGRVLRILPTPHGPAPFKLEATFTRQIPNVDHYTRIWLDPAGRIDLEYDTNHLTLLFPDGRIPRAISEKMPAAQLKDDAE